MSPTSTDARCPAEDESIRIVDLLRVLLKGSALLVGTWALILGFLKYVADGNDYALATLKKHERLRVHAPKKSGRVPSGQLGGMAGASQPRAHKSTIVFVGGSNLAFGLQSALIERATGHHVVNMGMNGFLGVRYMLEEVKRYLKPSDIAVLSFEYDSLFLPVDGAPKALLMVVKSNPRAMSYLSWKQRGAVAAETPYAAQMKLLRLMRTASRKARNQEGSPLDRVEALAGFNEYGDLTSHFGMTLPTEPRHGVDLSATPLNLEAIALMQSFAEEMTARGVTVLVSYTPVMREYYELHKSSIEELHRRLTQSPQLVVPSPPGEFALPRSLFFDTVYHPTAEGGELRTRLVVRDITSLLED